MRQLVSLPDTKGKLRQRGKKLEWQTFFSAPEQETYILFAFSRDMQSHFWTLKIVHPFVIIESEMWGSLHSVIQLQWDELLLRGTANWAAVFNNLNTKISPGEETVLPPTGGFFFFSQLTPYSCDGLAVVQALWRSQPTGGTPAQLFPRRASHWVWRRQKRQEALVPFCSLAVMA